MDPFTQRMLERARARREKLDTQLSNAGHDVKKKRSPLKDTNTILMQASASPNKISIDNSSKKSLSNDNIDEVSHEINKENGEDGGYSVKSKLQRLGKLYSEDSVRELSSPIHRTEEKFNAEDDNDLKTLKKGARLDRLAALASTINNWEDDVSHPSMVKQMEDKTKVVSMPQPSTSGLGKFNVTKKPENPKQLNWDKTVLENLESQGFSRTQSNSRLVYDYKNSSQDTKGKPLIKDENKPIQSPDKLTKTINPTSKLSTRFGSNSSPKNKSPGSVLSKASMFESKSSEQPKIKDPAQMSLTERMALFERNKGEPPLLPKAPLTMSVPLKKLHENKSPQTTETTRIPNKTVSNQRAIFEPNKNVQELESDILRNANLERQRELDMLRSRFNRNKEMAQVAAGSCIRTSESSEGKSSNSPKNSPVCPVKPTPAPEHAVVPAPPPLPQPDNSGKNKTNNKGSPSKRLTAVTPKSQPPKVISVVKRIKISPPKPGHLYPNLSGIEDSTEGDTDTEYTLETSEPETATLEERTETDTVTEGEYYVSQETESDIDDSEGDMNSSLGRSILEVVTRQTVMNKKRSIDPDPDSTTSDISVLDEMDEYLDECLALQEEHVKTLNRQEGPTPPKLNKNGKSPSASTSSFKSPYKSPIKLTPMTTPKHDEIYIVEGNNRVPLMHSVSFYRRQQSQTPKTPARLILRTPERVDSTYHSDITDDEREVTLVQEKIQKLLDEVSKQQTIIGQASQALNLCTSTVEFSGSREQVEGERLLLIATHRRQAALNEVQRLRVEGTLKPVTPGSSEVQESGSLTISAITLPLKRDYFRTKDTNVRLHFVCLIRHLEEIIATPIVVAEPGDSCLRFPSTLKLQNLYSDFKITIEVYSLQTQAEILPHEVKYHIHNANGSGNGSNNSNNKKSTGKTPKKYLKQETRLVMPSVQSPAGPSAVRSPAFLLVGYVVFSLREVNRQQFTLNKVPAQCSLEGKLQMHASCELSVTVEHRGFLTMFEDVSGFGAWHRRWCLLKGAMLSYWKYPDDEKKKTPIGSLDLQSIHTKNVGPVSRDICARPNTFLLETMRPAQSGDTDSLVMITHGSQQTTIRHLLSADTKEERLEWCSKLNKTLNLIHAWGGDLS